MNPTQKDPPGPHKMEPTGPKAQSRYLKAPTASRHDHCKCVLPHTIETKALKPPPKRIPKQPIDKTQVDSQNSIPKFKKPSSITPKVTTPNLKKPSSITPKVTTPNLKKPSSITPKVTPPNLKKPSSITPKVTPPNLKKPSSISPKVANDQVSKKDVAIEPKKRDLIQKSENTKAKTYISPHSRSTPRRRHSDICVPINDVSLPSSRLPKRRLSDITIPPNKDVASVSNVSSISNVSSVRGSRIVKKEPKKDPTKDSKVPLVNKKLSSLKTNVSTPKINTKVPTLRSYKSLPKPQLKGSRKSKPAKVIKEVVPEKSLRVIEPNNGVEVTLGQSQSQNLDASEMTHGENGLGVSSPPLIEDGTTEKEGDLNEHNVLQVSLPTMEDDTRSNDGQTNDQNALDVSSPPSLEDDDTRSDDGQHEDEYVLEVPLAPSMEDEMRSTDGQTKDQNVLELVFSPLSIEDDDTQSKDGQREDENVLEVPLAPSIDQDDTRSTNPLPVSSPPLMEDDTQSNDGQHKDQIDIEASSPLMEDDTTEEDDELKEQNELQESSPLTEDDASENTLQVSSPLTEYDNNLVGQRDSNVTDSEVNDSDETNDDSPDDSRFKTGTIFSPQSENNSPEKHDFKKGKELDEEEPENNVIVSLRRLSSVSDGVVPSPESQPISVDLKHQETAEKKDPVLCNKVIEETASKLIQTRKSKVKALVGAFEHIAI